VAWQKAATGGHQPWRFDARFTAVSFARDYLGYSDINRSTSERIIGDQAWVGVGPTPSEDAHATTAAVLHLARIGVGSPRPWEIVGTQDTTITLTTPAYGARVTSPVTVGGQISGVDESLRVQIVALGGPQLGSLTGVPAGGAGAPWRVSVPFKAGTAKVATIAVATGGHLHETERFAITGVRL
jgi:hypothetical protein